MTTMPSISKVWIMDKRVVSAPLTLSPELVKAAPTLPSSFHFRLGMENTLSFQAVDPALLLLIPVYASRYATTSSSSRPGRTTSWR